MKTARDIGMLVAVVVLLAPSFASAQNVYAALRGGPGWTPDVAIGLPGDEDPVSFNTGFTGSGAVGYAFRFGLRVEGEYGFIYAPVDREESFSISGSMRNHLFMANAYYDFKIPALGPVTPYVGFGLGGARAQEKREVIFTGTGGRGTNVDEWRTALAYQARVGVGYEVNRRLDLTAGYRHVHIDGGNRGAGNSGLTIHSEAVSNHSIELGVAFKF